MLLYKNRGCLPELIHEGEFSKPLVEHPEKFYGKNPFERVNCHHTLTSARRSACFKPFKDLIPNDNLDFILNSTYNHSYEIFPEIVDCLLQPETRGILTWRRLKNTIDEKPSKAPRDILDYFNNLNPTDTKEIPYKYNRVELLLNLIEIHFKLLLFFQAHPVVMSGIKERIDPNYVKLMNSSHHLPQTNAGYTRQPSDGTVFQY